MRTVVILAICVAILAGAGIIHFRKSGDRLNVTIDTGELRDKAEDFIDAVKEQISEEGDDDSGDHDNRGMDRVRNAIDSAEDAVDEAYSDSIRRSR